MSEAHLSGYRLIVGFESLDDLQDAQEFLARRVPPNDQHNRPGTGPG
jgi:hypothetical protein